MRRVIAIDPGGVTGWVEYDLDKKEVLCSKEIDDWYDVCFRLHGLLNGDDWITVVIEKFTISQQTIQKSRQSDPIDIIGAVKYLVKAYTNQDPVFQTPAEAKSFSTNDKLKAAEFWHKGGAGHANDAYRHLLLWLVKNGYFDPRDLLT
jgi:hypothetical protein